jgi:hypothetical protein
MKLHIEVTAEDIEQGHPNDPLSCPVARAIKRVMGRPHVWVSVGDDEVCFDDTDIELPLFVAMFVMEFDDGEDVVPFAFDLDVPDEVLASLPGEGPTGPG